MPNSGGHRLQVTYSPEQHQPHIRPINAPLHAIVAIFNPSRSASRYRLFKAFREHVRHSGAILTTVELALGERHFEVTSPENPDDVQVRSNSIMFHKENLLNIGWRHVVNTTDPGARYFCWPDADITFARPDWAAETVHLLQTYSVLQMWSNAINLGAEGEPIQHFSSFARDWSDTQHTLRPLDAGGKPLPAIDAAVGALGNGYWHKPHPTHPPKPGNSTTTQSTNTLETGKWHSGLAWAARRDVLEGLGGLGDVAILGSGDHHMAWSFAGDVQRSIHRMTAPGYQQWWQRYQERADRHVQRNLGYMPGTVFAHYHGAMKDRRYLDRWQVLNKYQFDPYVDLVSNSQHVYEWAGNKPALAWETANYFDLRREP